MYKVKKWLALMLAFVMTVSCLNIGPIVWAEEPLDISGYKMVVASYENDNTTAVIQGDGSGVQSGVAISRITAPDGTELDLQNPQYTVQENGNYSFTIDYQKSVENTQDVQTKQEVVDVVVDQIAQKETTQPESQPASSQQSDAQSGTSSSMGEVDGDEEGSEPPNSQDVVPPESDSANSIVSDSSSQAQSSPNSTSTSVPSESNATSQEGSSSVPNSESPSESESTSASSTDDDGTAETYQPMPMAELLEKGREVQRTLDAKAYEMDTYTYLGDVKFELGKVSECIPDPESYNFLKGKYVKEGAKLYMMPQGQDVKMEIGYITYLEFPENEQENGYYYTIQEKTEENQYSQMAYKLDEKQDKFEVQYPLKDKSHLKTISVDWGTYDDSMELIINGKLLQNKDGMKEVKVSVGSDVVIQVQHPNKFSEFVVYYKASNEAFSRIAPTIDQDKQDEKTHWIRKRGFKMPDSNVTINFSTKEWTRNQHKFALIDSTSDKGQLSGWLKMGGASLEVESGNSVIGNNTKNVAYKSSIEYRYANDVKIEATLMKIGEFFQVVSSYVNYVDWETTEQVNAIHNEWHGQGYGNKPMGTMIKTSRDAKGETWAAIGSYEGSSNLSFLYKSGFATKNPPNSPSTGYGADEYLEYSYWNGGHMIEPSKFNNPTPGTQPTNTDYIPLYIVGEQPNSEPRRYTTSDGAIIEIQRLEDTEYKGQIGWEENYTQKQYQYRIKVINATNDFLLETAGKSVQHPTAVLEWDTTFVKDVSIGVFKRGGNNPLRKHYSEMNDSEKQKLLSESKAVNKKDFSEGWDGATNNDMVNNEGWYNLKKGQAYYNKWIYTTDTEKRKNQADPWLRVVVEKGYSAPGPFVYWSGGGVNGSYLPTESSKADTLYFQFETTDHYSENGKEYVAYYYRMYSSGVPDKENYNMTMKFQSKPLTFTGGFYDTKGLEVSQMEDQAHVLNGNLLKQGITADPVAILPIIIPRMYKDEYFVGWDFYIYPDEGSALKDKENKSPIKKITKMYNVGQRFEYQELYDEIQDTVEKNGYQDLYIKAVTNVNRDGTAGYVDGLVNVYLQNGGKISVDTSTTPMKQSGYEKIQSDAHQAMIGQKPRVTITQPTIQKDGKTYIANQSVTNNSPEIKPNPDKDGETEITAIFYDQQIAVEYMVDGQTAYKDEAVYTVGQGNHSEITLQTYDKVTQKLQLENDTNREFIGWKIKVGDDRIGQQSGEPFAENHTYDFAAQLDTAVEKDKSETFYNSVFNNQKIVFEAQYKNMDEPPQLTVPEVLEFDVGDVFDPKDPEIITGLNVTDKEDQDIGIEDITVKEEVPREGKFLRLFETANTGKLTTAGTYSVEYSVQDTGGNKVSKTLKVKVHGLPYFASDDGITYEKENPVPTKYLRTKQTDLEKHYYDNLKAYYVKASDTVGQEPEKTELPNSLNTKSQENGILTVTNFVNVVIPEVSVDNINEPGKYLITYTAITPRGTRSEITRDVYVRTSPQVTVKDIIISESDKTNYQSWSAFFDVYKDAIAMSATVKTPNQSGEITWERVSDFTVQTDISKIPFGKLQDGDTYKVEFTAIDQPENYEKAETPATFTITVENLEGLAPQIQQPNEYDNQRVVKDKIMVNAQERSNNFIQALIDETKIYDVDAAGKQYTNTPEQEKTENNPAGERYGIVQKGIVSIERADGTKIYEESAAAPVEQVDAAIREMFDTVGEYNVKYYAVDGDNNRVESVRNIKVASETKFVQVVNYPDPDVAISTVNLRKSAGNEVATDVVAYHLDANGKVHKQSALAQSQINMETVGLQEIQFTTTHHYDIIPGTNGTKRAPDVTTKKYLIHGNVVFQGLQDRTYFVDQNVTALDGVTASFKMAKENGEVVEMPVEVTSQNKQIKSLVSRPQKLVVEYAATEQITGVEVGNTATGSRTMTFIGLPQIEAPESVKVKQNATQEDVKQAINATATIDLVDSTISLSRNIQYDFSDLKNGTVGLYVSYTIDGGESRTTEKSVKVDYINPPTITALPQLHMSVQDAFDVIKTPQVALVLGDDTTISENDIQVQTDLPLQGGKLDKTGTYLINYSVADQYGNRATFRTTVLVDSLPVIQQTPINERVDNAFNLDAKVTATYMQAQLQGEPIQANAQVKAVKASNSDGKDTPLTDVNKNIGKYQITYQATNGSGGQSSTEVSLYVHGNITFEPIAQKISFKTYPVEVLDGVKAVFDRVNLDGTVVQENADITSNINGNVVTAEQPGDVAVTYTAVDNITGVQAGKTATKEEYIRFVDFPQITAPETVSVQENETDDFVLQMVKEKTTASIDLVSEVKDLTPELTFAFMKDNSATVVASVSYQIGEQVQTATQQIKVRYAGAPAIVGQSVLGMSVGDAFDAIKTPSIELVLGADESLTWKDITIDSTLPVNDDGMITQEGTYPITYSVTDKYNNTATHTVSVQVDSVPVLETTNLYGRIFAAPQLTQGVRATYFEAQEKGRPIKTDAQIWVTEIKDAQGNVVAQDALNKVGKYTIAYEAMNSNGAKTVGQGNLYLHGLIDVQTKVLEIARTDSNQANQYSIQSLVQNGQIVATVPHTAQDGTVTTDTLKADSMEIVANPLDTSKAGQYVIAVKVQDKVDPAVETTAYVTVKVTEQSQTTGSGNQTPTSTPAPQPTPIVVTGDTASLCGWLITLGAATLLFVITFRKKHKNKQR